MLAEITAMLADVTGADAAWADLLTAGSRLEGDLHLDSLELAALADLLRAAYGDAVDLAEYLASLDIDQLIGLTVGDVAAYVASAAAVRP